MSIFSSFHKSENISELKHFDKNEDVRRLEIKAKKSNVLRLHFGCGPRVLKGWINIDLKFEPFENYLKYYTDTFYGKNVRGPKNDFFAIDVTKEKLPIKDNSVEVVFNEDFIEHLDQKEQAIFLAETYRVLKLGGVHRINTPSLLISMKMNSDFSKGSDGIYLDEWNKHIHKNVMSPAIIRDMAKMIGYSKIQFSKRDKSCAALIPMEYRPDPNDRPEKGNIFVDLIK